MRKIVRGGASRSFGIEVASLAGIPEDITNRSKNILKNLEKTKGVTVNRIEEEVVDLPETDEIREIIKDLDIDCISPMQAFQILLELKEKV